MRVLIYGCGQLASGVVGNCRTTLLKLSFWAMSAASWSGSAATPMFQGVLLDEPVMHDYLMEAGISQRRRLPRAFH